MRNLPFGNLKVGHGHHHQIISKSSINGNREYITRGYSAFCFNRHRSSFSCKRNPKRLVIPSIFLFTMGMMPPIGYRSIPIDTIFSGMNIHLPAILGFTRYQGFDPSPICSSSFLGLVSHIFWPKCHSVNSERNAESWLKIKGVTPKRVIQWIGSRENLQERPTFNGKIYGFL